MLCVYCHKKPAMEDESLCDTCAPGLDPRYVENNKPIVDASVAYAVTEFEALLERYAPFSVYQAEHPDPEEDP